MPRLQSEHVADRVHEVALARAVRPDYRRKVLAFPKIDRVRPSKTLKALDLELDDAASRLVDVHGFRHLLSVVCGARWGARGCGAASARAASFLGACELLALLPALELCFVWRRGQATRGSQLV